MKFVRLLRYVLTVGTGALAGTLLSSLILFQDIERASLAPLFFSVAGTIHITTAYKVLVEKGRNRLLAYLLTIGWGAIVGGFLLSIISGFENIQATSIGMLYGTLCAACWSVADYLVPSARPVRH